MLGEAVFRSIIFMKLVTAMPEPLIPDSFASASICLPLQRFSWCYLLTGYYLRRARLAVFYLGSIYCNV